MDSGVVFKIHHGTAKQSGSGLCVTCTNALIKEDKNGRSVGCMAMWAKLVPITTPVFNCNKYYNSSLPSLASMEEIAWTLETPADRGITGFVPPKPKNTTQIPR